MSESSFDEDHQDPTFEPVYQELKSVASRILRSEADGHSVQTTALVHDTYVKLLGKENLTFRGQSHFLAMAAIAMRRILVDHARHRTVKSRAQLTMFPDDAEPLDLARHAPEQLLQIDDALAKLAEEDRMAVQIVNLRFFVGMQVNEIAPLLGCSVRTVQNRWNFARAKLSQMLSS